MSLRNRLLAPVTAALVGGLVAGLFALSPAPASAGPVGPERAKVEQRREPDAVFKRSAYLCYGYQDCRSKGYGNAGYAQNSRTMYWRMYAGHNCTNYAAYRMVKSGLPNERPWSGGGNATYWGTSMSRITDDVPRVGAVTWWKANTGPAGSAGHVGYVEQVISEDEIIVSQDSWGGDFSWAVVTRGSGNWPSGFIHFNDVPMVNRAAPVISGVAKVGSTLSATAGSWKPATAEVRYQWFANGQKLAKSTKSTLRLNEARLGQTLTVTATASKLGYPTKSVTSTPTEAILPGQLRNAAAPAISGTAKVEGTLALDTGSWDPKPDSLAVQWYADGQLVEGTSPGATTLTLTPDLVDRVITATVTATRSGYDPVLATAAPTERVAPGTIRVTTPPRLLGSPRLGQTLTVQAGGHAPSDADVAIQWLRDGEPVLNATGPTYQITNLDLGTQLSARVTLSRAGYTTTAVDSPATTRVKTDPHLEVQVERIKKRIKVVVTVTAPGVERVTGPVVVRIAGVKQVVELRSNGTAKVVFRDLKPGERTLAVRYAGSATVSQASYSRDLTIR
ncbi:CHAP domain-containing protein [Nocardioides pyridinolyticus]